MKTIKLLFIAFVALSFASCEEKLSLVPYNGEDYVRFFDTFGDQRENPKIQMKSHSFWQKHDRDTIYFGVVTLGNMPTKERLVRLEQEDDKTVVNPAVAGVHFVPFDDAGAQKLLTFPANSFRHNIGVIVLNDPSLQTKPSYTLKFKLVDSKDLIVKTMTLYRAQITITK